MLKKMILFFIFIFPLINGCQNDLNEVEKEEFEMVAIVKNLDDRIEVEVIESDYAFGIYWIITSEETKYLDKDDNIIFKEDIKVGDKIEITYNGQVMMSYPPQVVAHKIKLL